MTESPQGDDESRPGQGGHRVTIDTHIVSDDGDRILEASR